MTVQFISHTYTAHASTGAAYQPELDALLDAIAASTAWVRSFSALKVSGNAYLGIMTHPTGAQMAFWLHATAAPFLSPYTNHIVSSSGSDDHLYISIKPANLSTSYDTTKDPHTDQDFVSSAGGTKFQLYTDDLDVNLANRKFLFVTDDTNPWFLGEYQEVPGTPGTTEAFHAISFDSNDGLLVPVSTYATNAYAACFILSWEDADLSVANLHNAQGFDYQGNPVIIERSSVAVDGVVSTLTAYISDTYDPASDWYQVPIKIAIRGETIGVIDKDYLCYVNPFGPSAKTKINSGNLQHSQDGMCWYWQNAWTVE